MVRVLFVNRHIGERILQLIEIIQLALLFFIALSAIIFFFSYLGYRTKSKLKELPKPNYESKKIETQKTGVIQDSVKNPVQEKPEESVKQNPRFEVYTPSSDINVNQKSQKSLKKKSHSPKTLVIKHKS
jgi:hypothetical protein